MPEAPSPEVTERSSATDAISKLTETSADVRGCAVLDRSGSVLASTGDPDEWAAPARALLAAADDAAGEPIAYAHVGTEDGEVFALRQGDLVLVAASDRFALAGLMFFDMRAALRELKKEGA